MKVMAIAPYEGLKELILSLGEEEDFKLRVEVGDLQKGVSLISEAINDKTDIIISRGGTAKLIQKETLIPVIEIEVSGFDILRVLTLVKDYPGKVAIVGFPPISEGAATVCEILDINIPSFVIHKEDETEVTLYKLKEEGFQIIIGGENTVKRAEKMGLNGILLTSGKESVLKAFENAKKAYSYISQLKNNKHTIADLILMKDEIGIIAYSQQQKAIYSNNFFVQNIRESFEKNVQIPSLLETIFKYGSFETIFTSHEKKVFKINGQLITEAADKFAVLKISIIKTDNSEIFEGIRFITQQPEMNIQSISFTNSEEMKESIQKAKSCRDLEEPIWIIGETGTGKEKLAMYIHFTGDRQTSPLLILDCEVITMDGWNEILNKDKDLLKKMNSSGTILLKNIDRLVSSIQGKLKNYLKYNTFGCRFISTSNNNILTQVEQGTFSADLYYLLASLTLEVPSLAKRKEDIESMVRLFISEYNTKFGKQFVGIRKECIEELKGFSWVGNIKQLSQIIKEVMLLNDGPFIELSAIKHTLKSSPTNVCDKKINLRGTLEEIEQRIIKQIWLEEGKNQTKTAERLWITRTTLWRKLK